MRYGDWGDSNHERVLISFVCASSCFVYVSDDRDHDMEFLQNLAANGIPGCDPVSNPTNGEDAGTSSNPSHSNSTTTSTEKEKRSAFALANYRDRDTGRGRRGYYGSSGRFEEEKVAAPEEFDIVALEDDKTVEISIIGSPATVSEAELLLRTHIGLITQIYKLSYDEAMLRRQVEALSLVVPMVGGGNANSGAFNGPSTTWNEKSERHHDKRRVKEDNYAPAWMNDNSNNTSASAAASTTISSTFTTPSSRHIEEKLSQHQRRSKPSAASDENVTGADSGVIGSDDAPSIETKRRPPSGRRPPNEKRRSNAPTDASEKARKPRHHTGRGGPRRNGPSTGAGENVEVQAQQE